MLNGGTGNFTSVTSYTVGPNPSQVTPVDVNQDGIVDLIVSVYNGVYIYYLRGAGDGAFVPAQRYFGFGNTSSVYSGFLTNDARPGILFGNWGGLVGGMLNISY
jgi:hypothetical protein